MQYEQMQFVSRPFAVPDVALMPVVKATVRSGNQPSAYIAVYIDCEDLTATTLTKRAYIFKHD